MLDKAYYSKTLLITLSLGTLAFTTGTAIAGFEWVPGAPKAPVSPPQETMQVQEAPVPSVSNEQLPPSRPQATPAPASDIIHVTPQNVQSEHISDVMTPSPFDTVQTPNIPAPAPAAAPAPTSITAPTPSAAPQPVINTIDFTNKAPAHDEGNENGYNANQDIEHIEVQNLNNIEEAINLPPTPAPAPAATPVAAPDYIPAATGQGEIIPMAQQPQQLAPRRPSENKEATKPLIISAYPDKPTEPALSHGTSPAGNATYAEAIGFGKDMPLALAVQQILPPGYAYSFAKSVNPGARVSWNGGKQWNIVLLDTLEQLGLSARIDGNAVAIVQSMDELSAVSSEVSAQI